MRALVLLLLLGCVSEEPEVSGRLYVIAGQSNAVGGVVTTNLADSSLATDYPAVQMYRQWGTGSDVPFAWETHTWTDLAGRDPDPAGGNKFHGVELSLGRGLAAKYGSGRVYLMQFAVNGTSLNADWKVAATPQSGQSTNLYAQLVAAIAAQESAIGARLEGIVWIQGNGDTNNSSAAAAYATNLKTFATSVRTELPGRDFRFVYDQLSQHQEGTYQSTVRAQQASLSLDPGFTMLNTDSYKLTDGDHYDSASFVDLGYAFARAL